MAVAGGRPGRPTLTFIRGAVDTWLGRVEDELWDWPTFLGGSAAVAAVLVAGLHLLQLVTLGSGNLLVQIVGVAPALIVAVAGVAAMTWALLRTRVDPASRRPYVLIMISGLVTVAVSIVALGGLAALLSSHGWAADADGKSVDLWLAERFYAWHLLRAVPLLGIPGTLGWEQPVEFSGNLVPATVVALKAALVLPAVRVAIAVFRYADGLRIAQIARARKIASRRRTLPPSPQPYLPVAGMWALALGAAVQVGIGITMLLFLFEPASRPSRWVAGLVPDEVAVAGIEVPLTAIQAPHEPLLFLLGLTMLSVLAAALAWVDDAMAHSQVPPGGLLGGALLYVPALAAIAVVVAAAALTLVHAGLTRVEPLGDTRQAAAALSTAGWHLAALAPFVELPETVGWEPAWARVDIWTGTLLLAGKSVALGVAVVGLTRMFTGFLEGARVRPARIGLATSAAEFATDLAELLEIQDAAQAAAVASTASGGDPLAVWELPRIRRLRAEYGPREAALEARLDALDHLFGAGEIADAAAAALTAAEDRSRALQGYAGASRQWFHSALWGPGFGEYTTAEVEEMGERAHALAAAYTNAARQALQREATSLQRPKG